MVDEVLVLVSGQWSANAVDAARKVLVRGVKWILPDHVELRKYEVNDASVASVGTSVEEHHDSLALINQLAETGPIVAPNRSRRRNIGERCDA